MGELGDNEMEDEDELEEEADEGSGMSSDEEEEGKVESESDGEVDENDELAVIRRLEKDTYKKMWGTLVLIYTLEKDWIF